MLEPREYYCDARVVTETWADAGVHAGDLVGVYRTDIPKTYIVISYGDASVRFQWTAHEMRKYVVGERKKLGGPLADKAIVAKAGLKFQPAKTKAPELRANCWNTDADANVNGHEHYKGRDLMAAVRSTAEATKRKGAE